MARRLPYQEGDVFAVPVPRGFVLGVVGRTARRGGVLGYFFLTPPEGSLVLEPGRADLVAQFGDPHLLDGTWTILGQLPGWDREKWPVPLFARRNRLTDVWRVTRYDDALIPVEEWVEVPEVAEKLPYDSLRGYDAMAAELAQLAKDRKAALFTKLPQLAPVLPPKQAPTASRKTKKRAAAARSSRA